MACEIARTADLGVGDSARRSAEQHDEQFARVFAECAGNLADVALACCSQLLRETVHDTGARRLGDSEVQETERLANLEVRAALLGRLSGKQSDAKPHTSSNRIRLDIGGTAFSTSKATLTRVPGSMLEAMFSGRHQVRPEDEGVFFIDRDGRHFHHILNYLRDGDQWLPPLDPETCQEVAREADYYGLPEMMEKLCPSVSHLSLVAKSHSIDLRETTLTLTPVAGENMWSAGAMFNAPRSKDGRIEIAVRLHQPSITHHFMLGFAPPGAKLDQPNLYMSTGIFLFNYAMPMLYVQGNGRYLPNLRSQQSAGELVKMSMSAATHGQVAVHIAVGEDPACEVCLDVSDCEDYVPVVLMSTVGVSLDVVDLVA
mmetsp:Transcript_41955/g.96286  ORF Transcript_41955/g.96286 Transcript_41955/m.96286 type:complete len:371 (+) Transcript_41955:37-1149(+)